MLTDQQAFLWRQRLLDERAMRNITDTHVRILLYVQGAVESGEDRLIHQAIADALGYGARTVGDALRRGKGIGLVGWEAEYRMVGGMRRRVANRYRVTMPLASPEPRPDLRRRHVVKSILPLLSSSSAQCADPVRKDWRAIVLAKVEQEKQVRRVRLSLGTVGTGEGTARSR